MGRFWEKIQARKKAELPVFLPFLLITTRKNIKKIAHYFPQTIDEIITTPIENEELQTRVRSLLQIRKFSSEFNLNYLRLFDNVPLGLYRTTPEGCILEANVTLAEMLGYPDVETLKGIRTVDIYVDLKDRKRWQELIESEGFVRNFEVRLRQQNGSVIWVEENTQVAKDPEGHVLYYEGSLQDITMRKLAEQQVRDSEVKYRTLFESAGDAIFLMRGDRFVECNAKTLTLFGCRREEIIGATPYDFSPPFQPDGRPSKEKAMEKIKLAFTQGPQFFEWEHCRLDKTPFLAEVTLNRLDLAAETLLQAIVRDITDRKQTEARLTESEKKYRELVEHANSIILHWNADGIIKFINEYGLQFFSYSAEELIGRHVVGTIVPPVDSNGRDLRQMIKEICDNPKAFEQNINENVRHNGERVWISWTNKIVTDSEGKVTEILSIGSDITERLRTEEEIRTLNEKLKYYAAELEQRVAERTAELEIAKKRAEEADRIKSAFLATMSHELRTPLNSIIGFTGILLQGLAGPLNEEQTKQLRMVQTSARHLLNLINDVLDISKIESGQLEIGHELVDMRQVIEKVVQSVTPMAEKKGLALKVDIAPEVGEIISDRRRVEQIFLNLLNNAIKFTDQGEVRVESRVSENLVVTSVSDTGIGINPEDMDKLFTPFYQIDTGLTRQYEGTGLGLSICKRLVELLGGEIWVESEGKGRGSTFRFTLPQSRKREREI